MSQHGSSGDRRTDRRLLMEVPSSIAIRNVFTVLTGSLSILGCGSDGRGSSGISDTCAPATVQCESAFAERICNEDGDGWAVNPCASGKTCVDRLGCTGVAKDGSVGGTGGSAANSGGGSVDSGADGSGTPAQDGGANITCQGQPTGTPCGPGKICVTGACGVSHCGDDYVDPTAGEQCEPSGSDCTGDCRWLPCAIPGPCLLAERNEPGGCVTHAPDDGTPCDDGNACTADDNCQGGVCVGSAIKEQPSIRGEVQTFGASPGMARWNEGVAAFVGQDRIVFLESKSYTDSVLKLVKADSQGLTPLSTAASQTGYFYDINWVYRPETHIVPLTSTDFAVVDGHPAFWMTPRNIEVFEIMNDQLVSHGVTPMPDDGPLVFGAAGRQDALWVCGPGEIETYDFDFGSKQLKLAARLPLGASEGCNALALAPDGRTLFMASKGVRIIDVSGSSRPGDNANNQVPEICPAGTLPRDPAATAPETCTVLSSSIVSDVQVSADYLAALTTDNVGDLGSALVVSMHDSTIIRTMEQDVLPTAGPLGLALAGNRLFVEWTGTYAGDGWNTINVALHPLNTDSTKPLAQIPLRDDCCGGEPWTLLSFVAQGDFAVLQPWRRVAHFDEATQTLEFVTGTEHGSLKALVSSSPTEVVAVGPYESHWIDISTPDSPKIISGGMNLSPASADFQLLTPNHGADFSLANTPPGILERLAQKSAKERFSILDTSLPPQATELGAFWIGGESDGETLISASRGQVFQLRDVANFGFRVRRYQTGAGMGLDVQELLPDLDTVAYGEATPDYPTRGAGAFGVNSAGTELLIVERNYTSGFGTYIPVATWLAIGPSDATVLARAQFNPVSSSQTQYSEVNSAQHIVLSGDQALVVDYSFAARLHRIGATIVQEAFHPMVASTGTRNPIIDRILAFDGERAALSVHHWTQINKMQYGVEILNGSDLSPLATYDTSEEVQSLLVVGTKLVFGMNSAVSVAMPYCP